MLRWNNFYFNPAIPETFPVNPPEWLERVAEFCRFWYSDEEIWLANTSGSTSEPKVIPLSRTTIEASARKSLRYFQHNPKSEGFLLMIPANAAGGFMLLARAFISGMEVLLIPPGLDSIGTIVFPGDKKWFVSMLPLQLNSFLLRNDFISISQNFSGILLGGGSFQSSLLPTIQKLYCPVFHSYGMTETASHIAIRSLRSEKEEPFELLEDFEIRCNALSCLEIKSKEITGNEWLTTQDIAEILGDGKFFIRGRAGQVINSGGLKIHSETEKAFLAELLPSDIGDFELLGLPDFVLQEKMVIVFFLQNEHRFDLHAVLNIFNAVSENEKRKKLPQAIYLLHEGIPVLKSGKTDFSALRRKIHEIEPLWEKPKKWHE
jgi:O-succinylbenzoic acid--CoA ligase